VKWFAIAVCLVLGASVARADGHVYRGEIAATDTIAGVVFIAGTAMNDSAYGISDATLVFGTLGLAGMVAAGPIDHALHDNPWRLLIGVGARVTVLPAFTYFGYTHISKHGGLIGLMWGYGVVTAIDIALAYRDPAPDGAPTAHVFTVGTTF